MGKERKIGMNAPMAIRRVFLVPMVRITVGKMNSCEIPFTVLKIPRNVPIANGDNPKPPSYT